MMSHVLSMYTITEDTNYLTMCAFNNHKLVSSVPIWTRKVGKIKKNCKTTNVSKMLIVPQLSTALMLLLQSNSREDIVTFPQYIASNGYFVLVVTCIKY